MKSPDDWVVETVTVVISGVLTDVEAVDWLGSDVDVGGSVCPIKVCTIIKDSK